MNGNQVAGLWLLNTATPLFTLLVAWRLGWLAWLWAFTVEYVRDGQPEQRTREEYARRLDFEDGLDIAEAIAAVPELDLDGTQPFAAVFHDDAPDVAVPTVVLGDGSYAGLSGTIPTDGGCRAGVLPLPEERRHAAQHGPGVDQDAGFLTRDHPTATMHLPFQPHAGPPAWRPRHAKTSWVDELITEALGAPTVEHYMWNWQQRHRLAITA